MVVDNRHRMLASVSLCADYSRPTVLSTVLQYNTEHRSALHGLNEDVRLSSSFLKQKELKRYCRELSNYSDTDNIETIQSLNDQVQRNSPAYSLVMEEDLSPEEKLETRPPPASKERAGLLQGLTSFSKDSLKKTTTEVTTPGGQHFRETKDESGQYKKEKEGRLSYGFVVDQYADLQVGEILPRLILGSQDVAVELEILEKYNVSHILNLATFVKNQFPDRFTYKAIDLLDVPQTHIIPHFEPAFEFINEGMKKGCVLVHCNAGVSRAATIVIAYLMRTNGWRKEKAYDYVKSKRPKISPNAGFQVQLETYEERLVADGIIAD